MATGGGADSVGWLRVKGQQVNSGRAAPRCGAVVADPALNWRPCGLLDSDQKPVRTYSRYRLTASTGQHLAGGYSDLRCGSQNWGYRHIVDRHLGQWEQKAALARQNWREVADYGIEWALRDPDRGTYRSSNGMSACQITSLVQALK